MSVFDNRVQAGKKLADRLLRLKGEDVVVLGIPRGGVVVANEVAKALGAPLDVVMAKKIGAPGEPEYALGAVGEEGEVVMNSQEAEYIGATEGYLEDQVRERRAEIKKKLADLRGEAGPPRLKGKVVVIVDDGIATGSTIKAAAISVQKKQPKAVVVAVPVAPPDAVEKLNEAGLEVVCLETPMSFFAIGEHYKDFGQVQDLEVKRILSENLAAGRTG
jgi:putative phosphoribosyl transferase